MDTFLMGLSKQILTISLDQLNAELEGCKKQPRVIALTKNWLERYTSFNVREIRSYQPRYSTPWNMKQKRLVLHFISPKILQTNNSTVSRTLKMQELKLNLDPKHI